MTERLSKPVRLWQLVPDAITATEGPVTWPAGARPVEDPCDVAFTGPYSFVVADSVGHRLLLVDVARNVCSVVADRQVWPNGVAVTADGKLLVTDRLTKVRIMTRLHLIHVSTCIPCRRLHVSCIGDKIVVNAALRRHVGLHLYPDTSCSSGILVSGYTYLV